MSGMDDLPARPPSEVEWEELLVRYELAPRALRLAVDDAGPERARAVFDALEPLSAMEAFTGRMLETMAAAAEGRSPTGPMKLGLAGLSLASDAASRMREIAAVRARSFAAVQRRGISVWEWETEFEGMHLTPYRLLLASVAVDGQVLAAVRAAARGAGAC